MDLRYLNDISGVQFMPVLKDKRPIHNNWQSTKTIYDLSNCDGVGIVCGLLSNNLEAIDFDLKYDTTGTLMNEYINAVNSINPNIIPRLVVQKTMSGGYHLIYRCSEIEGNQKLANRPSTVQEKQNTYNESYQKYFQELSLANPGVDITAECAQKAMKAAENDKVRVLIETRGEKGYIACAPMPGYELVQGDFSNIPEITPEDRSILFDVAFTFNTYFKHKEDRPQISQQRKNYKGLTPSEDYDQRGDVVALLQNHGWTTVGRKGSKIILRRPGQTTAKSSGNFDEESNRFSVFTTSTEFESQKPYKPYAVFCILECGGDYSQVTKKLADLGYGTPIEKIKEHQDYVPSSIDMTDDDDLSFLAGDEDYDDYINRWRTGTFEMGLSTGMPLYDRHFRFKKGNLVIVNGVDNVGKSTVIWYKLFLSALLHGWSGVIFSSENRVGAIKKKILEFYHCKPIGDMSDDEYNEANVFFNNHFKIIKNSDDLYNYQDILNMTEKVIKKFKVDFLLIDPYNSLRVEDKKSSYEFHYSAISKIKLFGDKNRISIYVNTHVNTTSARRKDENGHTLAPNKEDSEMGSMFANKADEFLTVHRLVNHEQEFMFTEIHVHKVKETETGGRVTPLSKPVYLQSLPSQVGFVNVDSKSNGISGVNPVLAYKQNKSNPLINSNAVFDFRPVVYGVHGEEAPF